MGHGSVLEGYTELGTTWANEINFGEKDPRRTINRFTC